MPTPINVLVIEDNTGDILLLRHRLLSVADTNIRLQTARSLQAGLDMIRVSHFEAILLDLSLPDSFGIDTLIAVHKIASGTPIIVTSGSDNEATRLSALEQGAQDYLSKDSLTGETLVGSIRYAIQRKQAKLGDSQ